MIAPEGRITSLPLRAPLVGGGDAVINTTGFAAATDGSLLVGGLALDQGGEMGTLAVFRIAEGGERTIAWRPPGAARRYWGGGTV